MFEASSPALIAATEAALAARPHSRVAIIEHDGQRYVAKRLADKPRRLLQSLFMRWLAKRITGLELPMATLALEGAAQSMDFEARRIDTLAAAGVRVPHIALRTGTYLLLEHCGPTAASLLKRWQPEEWRRTLAMLATELGEFHHAGLWHGGAQIKNITLLDGEAGPVSTRIDFEENFGDLLPLPATQAADLMLFLNSISLAGPIDESEARRLLPELLDAYFAAHPDAAVRQVLERALPSMRRLARLAGPFRRWSRKGIRRIELLVDILDAFLARPQ